MESEKIESFIQKLQSKEPLFTYEFHLPASFSVESLFEDLKSAEFVNNLSAFVCTDSPLGRLKHNAILGSLKLQNYFKIPSITTISMRDKNTLALQGELIGMNSLDLRLILALTGDPLRLGNQPQAKGVFEGSSAALIKIIYALNSKKDINGLELSGDSKSIYPFCVLNSYAKVKENLYKKMYEKIKNGALAIFTQPVYDLEIAQELLKWCENINKELNTNCILVFGFFPIFSLKTALFLHHKLPGVFIPQRILEFFEKAHKSGNEEKEGLAQSRDLLSSLITLQPKVHLMSSNKHKLINAVSKDILW